MDANHLPALGRGNHPDPRTEPLALRGVGRRAADAGGKWPVPCSTWAADLGASSSGSASSACQPSESTRRPVLSGPPARGRRRCSSARCSSRCPERVDWKTVLLLDGNIGIGGDPARLLLRCRAAGRPVGHGGRRDARTRRRRPVPPGPTRARAPGTVPGSPGPWSPSTPSPGWPKAPGWRCVGSSP